MQTVGFTNNNRSTGEPLDTTAQVETPEHVCFHYRIAGPTPRLLAYLLDALIRGFIVVALWIPFLLMFSDNNLSGGASLGAFLVVLFAIEWGYYVVFETLWSGRSPGKKALKLRVVKEGGYAVNFIDVVLRNLLRAADALPGVYGVGALFMALDPRFRRLGDMIAGTMVVVEEQGYLGEKLTIYPPIKPVELENIPVHIQLSASELNSLELFLRRIHGLHPLRGEELANILAPLYANRLGVPFTSAKRFLALIYHRATQKHDRGESRSLQP